MPVAHAFKATGILSLDQKAIHIVSSQVATQLRQKKQPNLIVLNHQSVIRLSRVLQQTQEHPVTLDAGNLLLRHLKCEVK
jgi:uncharacterized protein YaeQ